MQPRWLLVALPSGANAIALSLLLEKRETPSQHRQSVRNTSCRKVEGQAEN